MANLTRYRHRCSFGSVVWGVLRAGLDDKESFRTVTGYIPEVKDHFIELQYVNNQLWSLYTTQGDFGVSSLYILVSHTLSLIINSSSD